MVFLGAPGAGKGTQARILQEHYGYRQISTGDLLRENLRLGTHLGEDADGYMSRGELVPDRLIVDMVKGALPESSVPVIFDGFPRTIPQARTLDTMLQEREGAVPRAICFRVDLSDAEKRMLGRGRDDDTRQTVARRFAVFEEHRQSLEAYYNRARDVRFFEIDASQPVDRVTAQLLRVLGLDGVRPTTS